MNRRGTAVSVSGKLTWAVYSWHVKGRRKPRDEGRTHAGRMTSLLSAGPRAQSFSEKPACSWPLFGDCAEYLCQPRRVKMAFPLNPPLYVRDRHMNQDVCDFSSKYWFPDGIGFASDVTVKVAAFWFQRNFELFKH